MKFSWVHIFLGHPDNHLFFFFLLGSHLFGSPCTMIIVGGCCYSNLSVQYLLWIVYVPGYSQLFQGCGSVAKMTKSRLRSTSFHKHGSSSSALGFHECGSGALFFHDSGSSSGFSLFSHINILIVFVCLKLNRKLIKSNTQN